MNRRIFRFKHKNIKLASGFIPDQKLRAILNDYNNVGDGIDGSLCWRQKEDGWVPS